MYAVPWMVNQTGVSNTLAFAINVISLSVCCLMTLVAGLISDSIGRFRTVTIGTWIALYGAWPAFMLGGFKTGDWPLILLGSLIIGTAHGFFGGPFCACMARLVPPRVRVTVIAFGYSSSVGIVGGLAPVITEHLVGQFHIQMAPALVIMLAALISLMTLLFHPMWRHNDESFLENRAGAMA
jgi:MHS family proline/betaine transporter-like MFS transporter